MQSSINQVNDYTHPILDETSGCIDRINKEILKQSTILIKLVRITRMERTSQAGYSTVAEKISKKLRNHLKLWDQYHNNINEESMICSEELESVLKTRETLTIRKTIDDITDEEYRIKMAVVSWDIENLGRKKRQFEKSIRLLETPFNDIEPEDTDEIRQCTQDNFKAIRELELGTELYEMLISNLTKIGKNIP